MRYDMTMCDVNIQTFCTLFAMRPCSELLLSNSTHLDLMHQQ